MISGVHISQEIFAIDMLAALKSSLEHGRKHDLRLLQVYGDQASANIFVYCGWSRRGFDNHPV